MRGNHSSWVASGEVLGKPGSFHSFTQIYCEALEGLIEKLAGRWAVGREDNDCFTFTLLSKKYQ